MQTPRTELEKCLNGELFNTSDPEILRLITRARAVVRDYGALPFDDFGGKHALLAGLFARIGSNCHVDTPFHCDYGIHISLGDNVIIGMNCTFVDCNRITIGNNVLIASNVQFYTSTHPTSGTERINPHWREEGEPWFRTYARPITVGDRAWIGGGAVILPGVTIGAGAVIGAGSIVNRDVPPDSVAVGSPCRVVRKSDE